MSERTETEIKSMTKEQNYMCGYRDGKSDVLDKIIDSLKELSKDHRHNYVGNSCEERAWRLGIEDSIDLILAESEDA